MIHATIDDNTELSSWHICMHLNPRNTLEFESTYTIYSLRTLKEEKGPTSHWGILGTTFGATRDQTEITLSNESSTIWIIIFLIQYRQFDFNRHLNLIHCRIYIFSPLMIFSSTSLPYSISSNTTHYSWMRTLQHIVVASSYSLRSCFSSASSNNWHY